MLFLEFHGTEAGVAEQSQRFGDISREFERRPLRVGRQAGGPDAALGGAAPRLLGKQIVPPGSHAIVTDVCVPISRLAECLTETKRDIEASNLLAPIVAHAGDGNFHCVVLVMMNDIEEVSRAKAFIDRLGHRALEMEGTCTGEHGIGQGKKRFLPAEHGQTAVDAMAAIKRALDPGGIMNPGKIL